MKSPAEIKDAHDLLCSILSGHLPVVISRKSAHMLEAQYHVLCFVLGCENNACFKDSIDSLKGLLKQAHVMNCGRTFKSKALVE